MPQRHWLRRMSPASWLGALVLFFLPWVDVSCTNARGEVTTRLTLSGAQLAWGGVTDKSPGPERATTQRADPEAKVEIAPGAIKEDRKTMAGRWLLTTYSLLLLTACPSFGLVQPGRRRAMVGVLCSLVSLALLLGGSGLLLDKPLSPPEPHRMFDGWVAMSYTPWYYGSYLANVAALLCFGIEFWVIRPRDAELDR